MVGGIPASESITSKSKTAAPGLASNQAVQIFQLVANQSALAQNNYYRERADLHEKISEKIDGDSLQSILIPLQARSGGYQTHQNISGMGNGRIGQHALDICLRDGGEVSDRHGGDGYDAEQSNPMIFQRPEKLREEQPQQQAEASGCAGNA